jgi:hypothetical protein
MRWAGDQEIRGSIAPKRVAPRAPKYEMQDSSPVGPLPKYLLR